MVRTVARFRLSTRTMIVIVAISGLALGLYELSRRYLWGPWPRWGRAIRSSEDYYKTILPAAMGAVEGKNPDVSAEMAIPELIAVLDDPKDFPRIAAITALGRAGPKAAAAVPKLISLLKSTPWIQGHAAHALGEIVTPKSPEKDIVITALVAAANDAHPQTPAFAQVRAYMIQALTQIIGPENRGRPDLANLLTRSLSDSDGNVRTLAGLGIMKIGPGKGSDTGPRGLP